MTTSKRQGTGTWGNLHEGPHQIGMVGLTAVPYVSGVILQSSNFSTNNAEIAITFPYPAGYVKVINSGSAGANVPIRVAFVSAADPTVISGKHYIDLPTTGSFEEFFNPLGAIYLTLASNTSNQGAQILAGLLPINTGSLPILTGSGLTGTTP